MTYCDNIPPPLWGRLGGGEVIKMKDKNNLTNLAKALRNNMTDAERKIWGQIRNKQMGVKFRRQQPIGKYIVDFVCLEKKIVIELDGSQHIDSKKDEERDSWFKAQGYHILRFWNNDVLKNTGNVLQAIWDTIEDTPSP
jgi:very-short-patch-repair endonuclease